MTPNVPLKSRDGFTPGVSNYLDNLPPDVADRLAMHRLVGAAEAAEFCNFSLGHWRRLYRLGKVPAPIKLSERKLGWRLSDLAAFVARGGEG